MTLGWVALLLLAAATGSESSCDVDAPTRALLCQVEADLHPSFNPCLCSHVVFPHQDFLKDAKTLKDQNPKLKVLFKQGQLSSAPLPEGADGIYLSLDKPPNKEALPSDLKELAAKLDDLSSSKRAKAKYDGVDHEAGSEPEIMLELPSHPKRLAKHYDIKSLAKYVNYFVVPSDNLTDSSQDGLTYHSSRLMGIDDILNADSLVDLLSSMGADHDKLIIALPAFALRFKLKDEKNNMPGSLAESSPQKMSQPELCKLISEGNWMLEREEDMTAPYAYKGTNWISFDDSTSASIKGKYVLLRNLGGIAVTSVEDDDWSHSCSGRPLIDTLHHTMTNLARKSRAAQLLSLQDQIHNSLLSSYSGDVQLSPFRIVRVVDRAGAVHVVRKEAKTEFQCSRQGYFTHPSGCNRFYRCVKFNQYSSDFTVFEYDCPAGLAFDERYEVCVWPGSLPDASACKGSSEIAPVPRSRYSCSQEGYFADPENCRWFFACLDHQRDGHTPPTAYEFRCPFGLVFDNEKLACDWPWKVAGCGNGQAGYASVTTGSIYPGDILEGRLRPSYAQVSDAQVSGGRIPNIEGGLVLGTSLLSGIANQGSGAYSPGSNKVYGNGYGLGNLASYGALDGSNGQYVDNSGAYVHDPTGDTGGEYLHQEGAQVPYVHQHGPQVPYIHQSDAGAYRGDFDRGSYRGDSDSGSYRGDSDNGSYKGEGDSGTYRGDGDYNGQGDSGAYKGQGDSGSSGQGNGGLYRGQGDSGSYRGTDDSDRYRGQGTNGYIGQGSGGKYSGVGDKNSYKDQGNYNGNGAYSYHSNHDATLHGQVGSGDIIKTGGALLATGESYVTGLSSSGNALNSGAYAHDSRGDTGGAYVHQEGEQVPYIHEDGAQVPYLHQTDSGSYKYQGDNGAYKGDGESQGNSGYQRNEDAYKYQGSGLVKNDGAYLSSIASQVNAGLLASGVSGIGSAGSYVHDTRGDVGGTYAQGVSLNQGSGYVSGGAYVSDNSGAYLESGKTSTTLKTGPIGIASGINNYGSVYTNDVKTAGVDNGAYLNSISYLSGLKTTSGAYVHDSRGDNGGQYAHQEIPYIHQDGAQVPYIHQATGGAYRHQAGSNAYNYQGSYNNQDNSGVYVHDSRGNFGGYYGGKYQVGQGGYVKPNLYQGTNNIYGSGAYVHDGSGDYRGSYYTTGYQAATPVKTYGISVYQPSGSIVHGLDSTKLNVQSVGYVQPAVKVQPITVTSAPVVPLKPIQYIQPTVSPIVVTTPAPNVIGYQYRKPETSYQTFTVSSTPAPPAQVVQKEQPFISQGIQPIVISTPAPPLVGYGYKTPVPTYISSTQPPIRVSNVPVVPLNPVQYNVQQQSVVPCTNCAISQTARPLTVTATPIRPLQPVYTPTYTAQPSAICTSCSEAQTARPITVTSAPIVPFNAVQYSTPRPAVASYYSTPAPNTVQYVRPVQQLQLVTPATPVTGYAYQKPAVKYEAPVVHQTFEHRQPIQTVVVPKPVAPVVSYSYQKPIQPVVYSTPAPTIVSSTIRPVTVSSAPVVPLNPVQYIRPVQPIQVPTPAPPVQQYTYQRPAIKFETPTVQQTFEYRQPIQPVAPVVEYSYQKPIQPAVYSTQAPAIISSTVRPITVSSTPAVPLNPVQYIRPVQPLQVAAPAPSVVEYSYPKPAVKFESVQQTFGYKQPVQQTYEYKQPVQQTYVYKQPIQQVTFPKPATPVVNYSYQKPIQPIVYSTPTVVSSTTSPITVSSTPAVPYNPVQYVQPVQPLQISTPAPPVTSYSYPKPAIKFETVQQTYEYKQPIQHVTFPKPVAPIVNYSYQKPIQPVIYSTPAPAIVSSTVRPITVSSTPVVPFNPVQYVRPVQPLQVSTPAPSLVTYNYPKPAIKFETPTIKQTYEYRQPVQPIAPVINYSYQKPIQPVIYSTPPPPIVSTTNRPITVTSAPVVPLNPVQYVRPVQPVQFSTPAPSLQGYNYVKPAIKFETPVVQQTFGYKQPVQQISVSTQSPPVVKYSPLPALPPVTYNQVHYTSEQNTYSTPSPPVISYTYQKPVLKTQPVQPVTFTSSRPVIKYEQPIINYQQTLATNPPSIVSYQPIRTSSERPVITVSSTPAVPLNPVQYVKPLPPKSVVDYSYVQQTPVIKPSVSYSYPIDVSSPAPAVVKYEQQYIKQTVSTPAPPVVNYSYQPIKTQTIAPIVVSSTPAVPYNPVQYIKQSPPQVNYEYVSPQPLPTQQPSVYKYTPVKTVTTVQPPVINYSYQPLKPVKVNQPVFEYNYVKPQSFSYQTEKPEVVSYSVQTETPRPAITVTSTPVVPLAPVQYVRPAPARPIFNYNYVRPTPTIAVSSTPIVDTYRVTTPRPVTVQTETEQQFVEYKPIRVRPVQNYVSQEQITPIVQTTQAPIDYTPIRVRPTVLRKKPVIVTTTEQPSGVSYYEEYFDAKKTGGYEYNRPVVQFKEQGSTAGQIDTAYINQQYHSSFAPIVVPDISTALPFRKRPVQTYVNTVEEENYFSSASPIAPINVEDENLNVHLDIPKIGGAIVSSTTPEHIVEVTTVSPAVKRVRVKGGNVQGGGYYVRKQKVRVRPVVTTTENYPAFFTTTVKPVYTSTIDLSSPTLYSTTARPTLIASTTSEEELEVEDEDAKLLQNVSGGFGSVINSGDSGIIKQGFVSSTTVSSLKEGEAVVGVIRKEKEQYTGRKKTKVVVVSRLSDFNPLLVGKLGAECSCKSDVKTLDLTKTSSRGQLFRPTTIPAEPSRQYLPTSSTPLPAELTNNDYDDSPPLSQIVEIKPIRKVQRIYSTTGLPAADVAYETSTRPTRKISSASDKTRLNPDVDCQRPGLFRHPHLCNKFYSCNWDEWKKRYTVSVFNCPIHLAFDSNLGACNWPSKGPACSGNNLLV